MTVQKTLLIEPGCQKTLTSTMLATQSNWTC